MAYYLYNCKNHGEIQLDLKLGTASETEKCPECDEEMNRQYGSISSIWKTQGSFGQSK